MPDTNLIAKLEAIGLAAAKSATSQQPWYSEASRRGDMMLAAHSFTVATALRAKEQSNDK